MIRIHLFNRYGLMETLTCDDMGDVSSIMATIPDETKRELTFTFIIFKQ